MAPNHKFPSSTTDAKRLDDQGQLSNVTPSYKSDLDVVVTKALLPEATTLPSTAITDLTRTTEESQMVKTISNSWSELILNALRQLVANANYQTQNMASDFALFWKGFNYTILGLLIASALIGLFFLTFALWTVCSKMRDSCLQTSNSLDLTGTVKDRLDGMRAGTELLRKLPSNTDHVSVEMAQNEPSTTLAQSQIAAFKKRATKPAPLASSEDDC